MRAILTAVDYTDLLAVTLPWNAHHFEQVWVVTDETSMEGVFEVVRPYSDKVAVHITNAFHDGGATFNKWKALEQGLDQMGRHGWLCIMDADVLWPREVVANVQYETIKWEVPGQPTMYQDRGQLCSPLRRMLEKPSQLETLRAEGPPPEEMWHIFPRHRNVGEWAGYTQIFHAEDPHLGPPPWHATDFAHAGAADSFFQQKWPAECKVRPPWECLHIGPAGANWHGRSSPYLDGTRHPEADARAARMRAMWAARHRAGPGKFDQEKLPR